MTNVLAIDIGGTNTKIALVNNKGCIGQVTSIPTVGETGVEIFFSKLTDSVKKILLNEKVTIEGIGVGVAGFVDTAHARMIYNPNIAWLEGFPLKERFTNQFNLPVNIEIDSNAAALAEAVHGNGRDCQRLLVFSIGTGLGGGMVIDGQILRIANECLGDVGHVMVDPGGMKCEAGCRGCAEAMVSAPALERYAAEFSNGKSEMKTPDIIEAASRGEVFALAAINKLTKYFGIALASIVPVLAPHKICVAGGVSEAGDMLLDATRASFVSYAGPPYAEGVIIQKAFLGWQSVLVGAAVAFRREPH